MVPGLTSHLLRNRIPSHRWFAASPRAPEPWAPAACQRGGRQRRGSAKGKVVGQALTAQGLPQATAAGTRTWGGASSGLGTPGSGRSQEAPELQAQLAPRGALDHRPVPSSQELEYGKALGDRKGSSAGRRALCVPSQPWVTALGPAPCSSFPNEPPAAGRRLK